MDATQIQNIVKSFTLQDLIQIAVLLVVGYILIRLVTKLLDRLMQRVDFNPAVQSFLKTASRFVLWAILIVIIVSNLGMNMTGLVAVLSVLTLAVSLAVQGTLSNLAGGVQVLASHPFAVGDFVEIDAQTGTVEELGLVYTRLLTPDGRKVCIPNSRTSTASIINYSVHGLRRQDVTIGLSYGDDPKKVEEVLMAMLESIPDIIHMNGTPAVKLTNYQNSAIEYTLRYWTRNEDYWNVRFAVLRRMYDVLAENHITIPYPQLDLHMVPDSTRPS